MIPANKLIKSTLLPLLLIANYTLFNHVVTAQTAMGLSAIPPRLEVTVNPDQSASEIIKVRNESNTERTITTSVADFVVNDDKGTPEKVAANYQDSNRWASSSWIQISPSEVTLKPGETKNLVLTVMPPKNALPGGHYAMVIHTPKNSNNPDSTGFSIQAQVGTLVYITVPGDIKQDAQIKEFTAPKFSEYGPIDFQTTIKNLSDVHIAPQATILITNMIGGKTSELILDKTNIFPYTSRDFKNTLEKKWLFGPYKAQLNAAYGTAGGLATSTIFFWVIPWRLLTLLVAAVAIIIAIVLINKGKPPISSNKEVHVEELEKELEELKKKYKDRK